jgi:hypothetical protein
MELSSEAVKMNKSTEEKIREYVWLHADEPARKIQAGILEEFGETRSLEWISKEREEYLTADEHLTEENSFLESSIGDEAIQSVAEAFPSVTQEQIREVVRLKTSTRMGYRRIGKRLNPPIGKDTVMRIWRMYKALSAPLKPSVEDEEIKNLKAQLAEMERLKRIREEKEKLLKQHVLLSLETEGDDLVLRIVEDELAKINPETHQKFRQYCTRENLSSQAALQKIGVTASNLTEAFDDWYDLWNEDGKSGMECLAWEVWSEINADLPASGQAENSAKEERRQKEHQ